MKNWQVAVVAVAFFLAASIAVTLVPHHAPARGELRGKVVKVLEVSTVYYQGLARGGGYWFFSDKNALFKSKGFDGCVKALYPAIPQDLAKEGYDHIGDIDYYNGLVYAPVEDVRYERPVILLYNASSLSYVGAIGPLPQSHMPWVAVDSRGYIYSSEFDPVPEVYVYAPDGKRVKVIRLSEVLHRVQGGVVVNDTYLLLSTDDGGDWLYAVDLKTGRVWGVAAARSPYEGEGVECVGSTAYFLVGTPPEISNRVYVVKLYWAEKG